MSEAIVSYSHDHKHGIRIYVCHVKDRQISAQTHTSVLLIRLMRWQTEVSLSSSLTNTYNQHLRPPRTYAVTTTTRILSILSLVARVTLIIGCGRAHGTAEYRNDHNDAGERRSGTPSDEQGLSYTHIHTTPCSVCVCLCVYLWATYTDSPGTRVHACPAMIITTRRRSHSECVCMACVYVSVC